MDMQIRTQQLFNRSEHRNRVLRRGLGSPRTIWLHRCDKRNTLARHLQFPVDTKMIAAERAGPHNRYAQLTFAGYFLCPFAFNRLQAAAIQLKQLGYVFFRLCS